MHIHFYTTRAVHEHNSSIHVPIIINNGTCNDFIVGTDGDPPMTGAIRSFPTRRAVAVAVIAALVFASMLLLAGAGVDHTVDAATLLVDPDAPDVYHTIQEAIDNASAGDTVKITPGVYNESIIIDKPIKVRGSTWYDTLIEGADGQIPVTITSNDVLLTNISVLSGGDAPTSVVIKAQNVKSIYFGSVNVSNAPMTGMQFQGCTKVTFFNCQLWSNNYAVHFVDSTRCYIKNSTFYDNTIATYLEMSNVNYILNNTYTNNKYGTYLDWSSDNTIMSNSLFNNENGIYLNYYCDDNYIWKNNCDGQSVSGIYLYHSSNENTIKANSCTNNKIGVQLRSFCNNNLIQDNNCYKNTNNGISLEYSCKENFVFSNDCTYNTAYGLLISMGSDSNDVQENYCSVNSGNGIGVVGSTDNLINSNYASSNGGSGIKVFGGEEHTCLSKNHVNWNSKANIEVFECNNITLESNKMRGGGNGIEVNRADRVESLRNHIHQVQGTGMKFIKATNSRTYDCAISCNPVGMDMIDCTGMRTFGNDLIENEEGVKDNGENVWDEGYPEGGNFITNTSHFDFWKGPNQDILGNDGISDMAYLIPGGSSVDNYPLCYPANPPHIGGDRPTVGFEDATFTTSFSTEFTYWAQKTWTMDTDAEWLVADLNQVTLSGIPGNDDVGSYWINVTLSNQYGSFEFLNYTIVIKNLNDAPEIVTRDQTWVMEDELYEVDYEAEDIDPTNDHLVWHFLTDAPFLKMHKATGIVSGTPTNDMVGSYWVNISVTDGRGGRDYHNFTLRVHNVNDDPVITTPPICQAIGGRPYLVQYEASDIDSNITLGYWSFDTNATFLSFDRSTWLLQGTPAEDQVGTYWVNLTVHDRDGGSAYQFFILEVVPDDEPVLINVPTELTLYEDEPVELALTVLYPEEIAHYLEWSKALGTPFLSINTTTGLITGVPTNDDLGYHTLRIRVTDNDGPGANVDIPVLVLNTNDAPIILNNDSNICYEDRLYSVHYTATDIDPTMDLISWKVSSSAGFLSIGEKTGILCGMPSADDLGTYWVNVAAHDDKGGVGFSNFTLTVLNSNDAPEAADMVLELREDSPPMYLDLNKMFVDDDGDALTVSFSRPKGVEITLLGNGSIILTPMKDFNGRAQLALWADDGLELINATLIIHIEPVNDPPVGYIIQPRADLGYKASEPITFEAGVMDPDLEYEGDEHTFIWTSSKDGLLGRERGLDNITLSPGKHTIIMQVKDSHGQIASVETTIHVEGEKEETNWASFIVASMALYAILMLIHCSVAYIAWLEVRDKEPVEYY